MYQYFVNIIFVFNYMILVVIGVYIGEVKRFPDNKHINTVLTCHHIVVKTFWYKKSAI